MWQQRLFGDGRGRVFLTRALDPIIECRGIEIEEFCYGGWRVCGSMDRMGKQKTRVNSRGIVNKHKINSPTTYSTALIHVIAI